MDYPSAPPTRRTPRLRRWLSSPVSHLLRRRADGRGFDAICLPSRLRMTNLPTDQLKFIDRVARGASPRPGERRRVSDALVAEFQTRAAADGPPPYVLDERGARKELIRRLRREQRQQRHPLDRAVGRCIRWSARAVGVAALLSMIYFYFSQPQLETDYLELINVRAAALPEEERAWPIYRDVLISLPPTDAGDHDLMWYGQRPADPLWPQMVLYLRDNAEQLQATRRAASMPGFGLSVGYIGQHTGMDAEALGYLPSETESSPHKYEQIYRPIWSHLDLSQLGALRRLANIIRADAYAAAEDGDTDRLIENVNALLGMSQHVGESGVGIARMCEISFRSMAYGLINDTLAMSPSVVNREALIRLETLIVDSPGQNIDIDILFVEVDDLIQRSYQSHGFGPELFTANGFAVLGIFSDGYIDGQRPPTWFERTVCSALAPLVWTAMPTRSAAENRIDQLKQMIRKELTTPWWEQPWSHYGRFLDEATRLQRMRHPWEMYASPWLSIRLALVQHETQRDGLLVTLAMHRYWQDRGEWPRGLGELLPNYLAAIPADPVTGTPLLFAIRDNSPVVYSVGADGDDDGGVWPTVEDKSWQWNKDAAEPETPVMAPDNAAAMRFGGEDPADGDWVLFPTPAYAPAVLPEDNPYGEYGEYGGYGP